MRYAPFCGENNIYLAGNRQAGSVPWMIGVISPLHSLNAIYEMSSKLRNLQSQGGVSGFPHVAERRQPDIPILTQAKARVPEAEIISERNNFRAKDCGILTTFPDSSYNILMVRTELHIIGRLQDARAVICIKSLKLRSRAIRGLQIVQQRPSVHLHSRVSHQFSRTGERGHSRCSRICRARCLLGLWCLGVHHPGNRIATN